MAGARGLPAFLSQGLRVLSDGARHLRGRLDEGGLPGEHQATLSTALPEQLPRTDDGGLLRSQATEFPLKIVQTAAIAEVSREVQLLCFCMHGGVRVPSERHN